MDVVAIPNHVQVRADIADLITRTKGLDDIHDDVAVVDGQTDYVQTAYEASEITIHTSAAVEAIDQVAYTKEIEVRYLGVRAVLRIRFKLQRTPDNDEVWGRIYKDGIAHGAEFACGVAYPGLSYPSEDLVFDTNDLVQIYCKKAGGAGTDGELTYFRIRGDIETDSFVEVAVP